MTQKVIKTMEISPQELQKIIRKESLAKAFSKKDWALGVLALVKKTPDTWIKLKDRELVANATRHLKPLGIKYTSLDLDDKHFAFIFVKWETQKEKGE
jgi:hypothetical protein